MTVVPFDAPRAPHSWPNRADALLEATEVVWDHILDDLLARGADVHRVDDSGSTALLHAASNGNLHAVEALVKAGADPNHLSARGFTPHMAAMAPRQLAAAQRLAQLGADTNAGAREEVRFSRGHYGTVAVWYIQAVGVLGTGTAILWPLSVPKLLGFLP